MNDCVFSDDRRYRYLLAHAWADLPGLLGPTKAVTWIGLNPSTADEHELDPTLRRVKGFSQAWGFNTFYMVNLFAWRATDPKDMKSAKDPIGWDHNDYWIKDAAARSEMIIGAWGAHGSHLNRATEVRTLLYRMGREMYCLGLTKEGHPKHPLYLALATSPVPFSADA